jgi:hypothetical protein
MTTNDGAPSGPPPTRRTSPWTRAAGCAAAAALFAAAVASTPSSATPVIGGGTSADPAPATTAAQARLVGRSSLPAETYRPGSARSGYFQTGTTAVPRPYPAQPVQGFSAMHRNADGSYLVMTDNGYGQKGNSQDFELVVNRIRPDTATGTTDYLGLQFVLSDPDHHVDWTIWRDGGCAAATSLPAGYTCPAGDRVLTGWDFDPESMQVATDGTFWFGDEFGPFLLHADAHGRLLESPITTPGVKAPQNPSLASGEQPNLASSRGFEGMAISPNGQRLYPMLEGSLAEDKAAGLASDLRIFEVKVNQDLGAQFTGTYWRYRLESPGDSIGDAIAIDDHEFLVVERDAGAGPNARFKAVFTVDLKDRDHDGYADKQLLVNLLAVPDPANVGKLGAFFPFSFETIEDLAVVDDHTIAVMNDNNFPNTGGRSAVLPDPNEYIEVALDQPLGVDPRLLSAG